MALPVFRGCSRLPSTFGFTRLFLSESVAVNRTSKTRLPPPSPAAVTAAVRPYSSDRGGLKPNQKVVVVGIPNPFMWIRTRIYYFLIRAYFDKEFSIEDFTEGAKQVGQTLPGLFWSWRMRKTLIHTDIVVKVLKLQVFNNNVILLCIHTTLYVNTTT